MNLFIKYFIAVCMLATVYVEILYGNELDRQVIHDKLITASEVDLGACHIVADVQEGQITNKLDDYSQGWYNNSKKYSLDLLANSPEQFIRLKEFQYENGQKMSYIDQRILKDDYSIIYFPSSGYASLDEGVKADPGLLNIYSNQQWFSTAGQPVDIGGHFEEIYDVIENENILRIVYGNESDFSVGTAKIIDIYPEFGYRLKSFVSIYKGHITKIWNFDNYIKVCKDQWYPFSQEYVSGIVSSNNNYIILSVQNKDWSIVDHIQPGEIGVEKSYVIRYEVKITEFGERFQDDIFDITFPAGTKVVDTRYDNRMTLNSPEKASEIAVSSGSGCFPNAVTIESNPTSSIKSTWGMHLNKKIAIGILILISILIVIISSKHRE